MLIFIVLALVQQEGKDWGWPIDTQHGLTASFAEYRGLRLHMGLDFSTAGQEGMPVYPARAGEVFRVRAQKHGYGKSVYMEHANKWVTVYAHLAAFGPKLAAAIRARGVDPAADFGTLDLQLPLFRDQLLAHSGESGAGMPHFHFEVRKDLDHPVNPLSLPFPALPTHSGKVVYEGLYLTPLDTLSSVNGTGISYWVKPNSPPVRAQGRLGVRVLTYLAGTRNSRLGCGGVRLVANGDSIASWLPSKLSFDEYRFGGLVHDQAFSGFSPTHFAYCFDDRVEVLPALSGYTANRELAVKAATKLSVEVMDLTGVWTTFKLVLDPKAKLLTDQTLPTAPVQATSLRLHAQGDRIYFFGELPGTLQLPDMMLGLGADQQAVYLAQVGPNTVVWKVKDAIMRREVGALPRTSQFKYLIGDWQLQAQDLRDLPPVSVFLELPDHKIMKRVLEYHSSVLHFGRPGFPTVGLRAGLRDRLKNQHLGIYAWSFTRKAWRHWGALRDEQLVNLDYLTPLVVAADISPPTIHPPKRHTFFVGRRVVIPLNDKGSGINADSVQVHRGDQILDVNYDSDRGWIILPAAETKGPWSVLVKDRAELETRTHNLKISEDPSR